MGKHRYEHHLKLFIKTIRKSEKQYKENSLIHPAHYLYINNGRTPFFQLQGLARIDANISKHAELAEKWLDQFKKLEDAFGKYDFWVVASEANKKWKLDNKISQYINEQLFIQLGVLEAALTDIGWLIKTDTGFIFSEKPFVEFQKSAKGAEWHSEKKEKKKLLKYFIEEAQEIEEKLKSKEIDLQLIEEGIHEFRRKLRWLSIYASALNGKVALGDHNSSEDLTYFITKANTNIPFNKLPKNSAEKEIVYFLPGGFYAMSELISIVGSIKDPALYSEELNRIAGLLNINKSHIKNKLSNEYLTHHEAVKKAKLIIEKYVIREQLLTHISSYFDRQIN